MKHNPKFTASRIDFALASQSLCNCVVNTMYLPGIKSDHSAYFVAIDQIKHERGKGYWKFNNKMLHDISFVTKVNKCIEEKCREAIKLKKCEKLLFIKKYQKTMQAKRR